VIASIYVVPHEYVVCVWYLSTHLKKLEQVVKLSVDVATYGYRRSNIDAISFSLQDLFSFVNELLEFILCEKFALG
jgi:hypothetical protein